MSGKTNPNLSENTKKAELQTALRPGLLDFRLLLILGLCNDPQAGKISKISKNNQNCSELSTNGLINNYSDRKNLQ